VVQSYSTQKGDTCLCRACEIRWKEAGRVSPPVSFDFFLNHERRTERPLGDLHRCFFSVRSRGNRFYRALKHKRTIPWIEHCSARTRQQMLKGQKSTTPHDRCDWPGELNITRSTLPSAPQGQARLTHNSELPLLQIPPSPSWGAAVANLEPATTQN